MLENRPYYLQPRGFVNYPRGGVKTTGKLCISSNPSGALIYIDGIVVTKPNGEGARTNTCIDVMEGRKDIVLRMEGYQDHAAYVDIYPGKTVSKYINMESSRGATTTPLSFSTPLKIAGLFALAKFFI